MVKKKKKSSFLDSLLLFTAIALLCIISYNIGRNKSMDESISALKNANDTISQQEYDIQTYKQHYERADSDTKCLIEAIRFWRENQAYVEHVSIYNNRAIFYLSDYTWWDYRDDSYVKIGEWSSADDFYEDTNSKGVPMDEYGNPKDDDDSKKESPANPFMIIPNSDDVYSA